MTNAIEIDSQVLKHRSDDLWVSHGRHLMDPFYHKLASSIAGTHELGC